MMYFLDILLRFYIVEIVNHEANGSRFFGHKWIVADHVVKVDVFDRLNENN